MYTEVRKEVAVAHLSLPLSSPSPNSQGMGYFFRGERGVKGGEGRRGSEGKRESEGRGGERRGEREGGVEREEGKRREGKGSGMYFAQLPVRATTVIMAVSSGS